MIKVKIKEDVTYENDNYICKFIKGNFLTRYNYYTYECIATNKTTGRESKCIYIEVNTLKWWLRVYGFELEDELYRESCNSKDNENNCKEKNSDKHTMKCLRKL